MGFPNKNLRFLRRVLGLAQTDCRSHEGVLSNFLQRMALTGCLNCKISWDYLQLSRWLSKDSRVQSPNAILSLGASQKIKVFPILSSARQFPTRIFARPFLRPFDFHVASSTWIERTDPILMQEERERKRACERARASLARDSANEVRTEGKVHTFLGEAEKRVLFVQCRQGSTVGRGGFWRTGRFTDAGPFTDLALDARSARQRRRSRPLPTSPPEERSDDRGEAARGEAAHACRVFYMQGFL